MLDEKVGITECLTSEFMAPRLTAVITSRDNEGEINAAPFSFFTPISYDPPLICFSIKPQKHHQALQYGLHTDEEIQPESVLDRREYSDESPETYKDTLSVILDQEEFGVNLLPAEDRYVEAVIKMSQRWPKEENEIEISGLTPLPSSTIGPPLIKESYAAMECKLAQCLPLGDEKANGNVEDLPYHLIIGEGVALTIDSDIWDGSKVSAEELNPMLQFTGGIFGVCNRIVEYTRLSYPEKYVLTTDDPD